MRLGLVGTGPQAQRYLMPKNGGAHIVSQVPGRIGPAEYQDWLQGVDGVIIATHPRGHRHLALDAIAEGKHVLIEKPLALNLEDCEEILDAAERAGVKLGVAHTLLWSSSWKPEWYAKNRFAGCRFNVSATYVKHERDYDVWLDWGPHLLALAEDAIGHGAELRRITLQRWNKKTVQVMSEPSIGNAIGFEADPHENPTPMSRMVKQFTMRQTHQLDFQRRVYRALFAQENHATR
jgi:hypothetical protein